MWFLMSSLETVMVGTTSPSERNNTSAPSVWLSHKAVPCTCASCFHFTQHCLYIYMKIISYSALPLGASASELELQNYPSEEAAVCQDLAVTPNK